MRKFLLIFLVAVSIASAFPFNTVSAWIIPPGHGYFGPSVPFTIEEGEVSAIKPVLWAGIGALNRFDVTVMTSMEYADSVFSLNYVMVEGRYGVVETEGLAVSPLVDLYMPLQINLPWAISPGMMASSVFYPVFIHGNLFVTVPLDSTPVELYLSLTPDVEIADFLTAYVELNSGITFDPDPPWETWMEIWPGISFSPGELFSINTAVGIPVTFDYLVPGIAVYVNF